MAQPRIPITTIRYKTFVKQTVVSALRTVFTNHPDAILASTKTTIDFPFTEAEYPAVVVRFYERTIKNAGVGHEEYLSSGELVDQGTWFDPFVSGSAPFRSVQDYKVVTGSYPASGTLTTTNFKVIPLKPTQAVDIVTGQRSHVRVNRVGSEAFTIRSSLAASTVNSVSFVAEVVFGASDVILRLIYIDGAGVETVLGTTTLTAVAATSAGLGISAVRATTSALRPSGGGTTNNNQRSVVFEAGAIVINGAGGNPRATADATIAEINKRLGMQGG